MNYNDIPLPEILPALIPFDPHTKKFAEHIVSCRPYTIDNKHQVLVANAGVEVIMSNQMLRFFAKQYIEVNNNIYRIMYYSSDGSTVLVDVDNKIYSVSWLDIICRIVCPENKDIIKNMKKCDLNATLSKQYQETHNHYYTLSLDTRNMTINHIRINDIMVTGTQTFSGVGLSLTEEYSIGLYVCMDGKMYLPNQRTTSSTFSSNMGLYDATYLTGRIRIDVFRGKLMSERIEMIIHPLVELFMDMKHGDILTPIGTTKQLTIFENILQKKNIRLNTNDRLNERLIALHSVPELLSYIKTSIEEAQVDSSKYLEPRLTVLPPLA